MKSKRNVAITTILTLLTTPLLFAQIKVTDSFGRDVTENGISLVDWQGHLMNPMTRLTLTPPDSIRTFPLKVTIKAEGTSRLMLDLPSTLSAKGAEKTVIFENPNDPVEVKLAIAPDRAGGNGEIETYEFTLKYGVRKQTISIKVLDLDDDLLPQWPLVFDYRLDTITELFDTPGFREASELAMKDWFYFFEYEELDMVPAGAEVASLPGTGWTDHETIANDRPYNGFWVFKRTHKGPYATGFPNNAGIKGNRHTINGAELPGRLARSGSLIMHDNPKANWLISTDDEEWYKTDPLKFVDVYGLTFHEFGHAIVFHTYLPGFSDYIETPEKSQRVIEYQGAPVGYAGSGHLVADESIDRLSGHSGGYNGVFPPRRWMPTKLVLLIAQETGWKLRKIGPFIKPSITTDQLPNGKVGRRYSQILRTNNGGVPVYDWKIKDGKLPKGLSLNRFTGEISGKLSTTPGEYTFTVELKDDDALSQPVTKKLTIKCYN